MAESGEKREGAFVEVFRAQTAPEATEIVAVLGANGIPATTSGEALGEILGLPAGPLAEVRILVPEAHAERAREILAEGSSGRSAEGETEE